MADFHDTYNANRRCLPAGIDFEGCSDINTFLPLWKGQVLFIALDSADTELEEKYKNGIKNHNSNVDNIYPDSGFDLFVPTEFSPESKTEKIDYTQVRKTKYYQKRYTWEYECIKAHKMLCKDPSALSKCSSKISNLSIGRFAGVNFCMSFIALVILCSSVL